MGEGEEEGRGKKHTHVHVQLRGPKGLCVGLYCVNSFNVAPRIACKRF